MKKVTLLLLLINVIFHINCKTKIFVTVIPKCGTHLLKKCLTLMLKDKEIVNFTNNRLFIDKNEDNFLDKEKILFSHAIGVKNNIKITSKYNFNGIFMYRDPRDHIISLINYIIFLNGHFLDSAKQNYKKLNFNELFFKLIDNYGDVFSRAFNLVYCSNKFTMNTNFIINPNATITDIYNYYLPWINQHNFYVTTFERLVGEKGGGKRLDQVQEIINISKHIGLNLSISEIDQIIKNLWGKSTFREGKIGSWKKYFSFEQKQKFKRVAGQLLIDLGYEKDFNW